MPVKINNSLAVLITCYNRKQKTLMCLTSLQSAIELTDVDINIFLVDVGSTDGTRQAIENKFPEVNIINGNGRLFWNGGMIKAWQTANKQRDFDFYLWLNDDTNLISSALNELLEISAEKNNKSLICGICRSVVDNTITYSGIKNNIILQPTGYPQLCDTINGNLVLVPKNVFEKVGYLDKQFAHSIGDFDYGYRAAKLGVKIYTSKNAVAVCEANTKLPLWCYGDVNVVKRFKHLYSPLGYARPFEYFVYKQRHFGLIKAIIGFLLIHVRVMFPSIWNMKRKNKLLF